MNSEREQKITSVFHSAVSREGAERRAFLDGACASDPELRREVEALIEAHEGAGTFLGSPAYDRSAELLSDAPDGDFTGRNVGRYRVVRRLGVGGMGEVYLAVDGQLGRPAALKILPQRLTADESLVARFRQEARAASALNHPNIVTIYEVGEENGTHFIATEYVEGLTLRERMSRTPLSVGEAIDVALQVAAALSKAHQGGVVHRDVKPENIMFDAEGHAKVLDFGIAKLTEKARDTATDAPTALKIQTSPGAVMGTAHYMSPEQSRGLRDVDARTDIFSLGVVLYEMLAGRQPFEGGTASDVMAAILDKEPPPLARFNREVSEALDLVVQKTLAKDREERYQTAKELMADLRRVKQRLDTGTTAGDERANLDAASGANETRIMPPTAAATHGTGEGARTDEASHIHTTSSAEYIATEIKRHKRAVVLALVAFVAVAAGLWMIYKFLGWGKPAAPVFQTFTVSRITTSGRAQEANISQDGRYVVYLEMADDGNRSLWVKQTATGNALQIVPPTKGNILKLTSFSPDGNFVYYLFSDRTKRTALYQVSSVGGTPKKIIDACDSAASVSPDGRKLAFVRNAPTKSSIFVANVDGTGERSLTSLPGDQWFSESGPAWAPDGGTIAITSGIMVDGVEAMRLLGVDTTTGNTRELSRKRWANAGRVVWMPSGDALVLTATERVEEFGAQVWRVAYASGDASRVTNDVQGRDDSSLGVTADGRTLLTVTMQRLSRIDTVPDGGDANRVTNLSSSDANQEGYYGLALAPDGRIVFSSLEDSQPDLWIMNGDGSGRLRLTSDTYFESHPAVSPDGRYIVFRTNRPDGTPAPRLWRMDIDGGNLVQLAVRAENAPHISPDGRWVVYDAWSSAEQRISVWKVSIDGGDPVRVADFASSPSYSPDGQWIVSLFRDESTTPPKWEYGIIQASDGRPVRQFDFPGFQYQYVQWTADGRAVSFIGTPPDPSNIWLQPAEGGEPRKLTDFKTDYIYRHAWSRDGKQLALARGRPTFDVVLMKDEK